MSIPMVANGDCKSLDDANRMFEHINCDGVMAARGILANPTLFTGKYDSTPLELVQDWVNLGHNADDRITFQCFHHHLTFMLEKLIRRRDRVIFNSFTSKQQVFDFLRDRFDVVPHALDKPELLRINCEYDEQAFRERVQVQEAIEQTERYNSERTCGKFFMDKLDNDSDDNDDGDSECEDTILNCLFG